ncbi:MAG: spore germination protein, partial [Oscillospiraceae bacterium]|nr:spore germination protein [Oscillospiraceae bacterium]
ILGGKTPPYGAGELLRFAEVVDRMMSGFAVLLFDNCRTALAYSMQGFSFRAISESYTEENVRSSREGFAEPLKVNMTLIRRRIKSGLLVFESMKVGSVSNTDIALVYLKDRVSERLLEGIRKNLKGAKIELVLESGFIQPFLSGKKRSLFSGVGHTERPDTLCGKLLEGRVGILVDGTPFALITPYLFTENFQSFDDYTNKPYYAGFIRILKYAAFIVSILLPGLYVAVINFNPELIPLSLLYNISLAQLDTPLPLMYEALFIHLVYEIVREAGLRLPRPVGHAVSLIGALVVGEAAVNAGLIGSPMVMCVALTAISSFTIPMLYEPVTMLRFSFIIVGGLLGIVGLALGLGMLLCSICAVDSCGIPYTAPLSPYSPVFFRDGILRQSWRKLADNTVMLKELHGAKGGGRDGEHK